MHQFYRDIIDKISEEPLWFDEEAVPRYCEFHPKEIANIYADECVLFKIACQGCGREFDVAMSGCKSSLQHMLYQWQYGHSLPSIAQQIRHKSLHYGDPPNVECCPAGNTMNCDDLVILQYWHRINFEWTRGKHLEVELPDGRPRRSH